ncbi:circadian clock-controlled protein daywake-like [Coccinella septempunctata]|uniref:circadian clock-controlled protein daywake-like n=1 Tax=Coccinella septempunctata TaxID=41139 RepID=UPI001D06E62B|nr:circadian clock-controlled protein daywake-like [Coccinella septempunctata]
MAPKFNYYLQSSNSLFKSVTDYALYIPYPLVFYENCNSSFNHRYSKSINTLNIAADTFKKCSRKDAACLKDAIQDAFPKLKDGIPELGVPSLDPLHLGNMVIGAGGQAVGVVQKYQDAEFYGLSNSIIDDFIFDIDGGKIALNFTAPVAYFNASYELNGKILVLPIVGHGQCSFTLVGSHGDIDFKIETYTRNHQKHIRATEFTFEIVLDRLIFNLDNLFDGNAELSENMLKVLNENWEPLYREVIGQYAAVSGKALTKLMNEFFAKVPISELFLD